MKQIVSAILFWLSFIPFAIGNGMFRELVLLPRLGVYALPVSGVFFIVYIFAVTFVFLPRLTLRSRWHAVGIGLLWVGLTITFECVFGWFMGQSMLTLLKQYDITTGNLWAFIVLAMGVAPWLVWVCTSHAAPPCAGSTH
ncbi:hypothetical protein [Desulfovibrio cuneatus]|uniref:hypothetical protein n=1 Tax=Desulfovibrio cuneatus TaxID=159728 RepID=UPI0006883962|nr:hypothetical protein [Desulfovibrio cuneatus]